MIRINEKNKLPNKSNKTYATSLGDIKIDDEDVNEIIEEAHMREEFNKVVDIGLAAECEFYDDSSNNEEESSVEKDYGF